MRTGRALAQAIPRSGVTNADYWAKHGEKLLGAFMGVAGLSRLLPPPDDEAPYPVVNMERIATWVTTMADASDAVGHLSAGRFTPLVGAVLPLERLQEAHELMEGGRVIGKVIVKPDAVA